MEDETEQLIEQREEHTDNDDYFSDNDEVSKGDEKELKDRNPRDLRYEFTQSWVNDWVTSSDLANKPVPMTPPPAVPTTPPPADQGHVVDHHPQARILRTRPQVDYSNNGAGAVQKANLATTDQLTCTAFAYITHLKSSTPKHPKNIAEVGNHIRSKEYKESILREMGSHQENNTFVEMDISKIPPGSNIINMGMIYDFKTDSLTKKEIIKSRWWQRVWTKIWNRLF